MRDRLVADASRIERLTELAACLTDAEAARVLEVLHSPRFAEASVAQTWATLLDEGTYLCSQSTMHRLLRAAGAGGDRRRQATHPARARPGVYSLSWTRNGYAARPTICVMSR